ncbi:MAG: VCBS repeat-containing protein, partial [Planctomycetota bacterium]
MSWKSTRLVLGASLVASMLLSSAVEAQFASRLRRRDLTANTMNFVNVTGTNVIEVVPETPINEKEVEFGDFDKDGDLDALVVTGRSFSFSGRRRNKLYLNNNGVLEERSDLVSGPPDFDGFSDYDIARNGFFRDYDNDGWLDMVVLCDDFAGLEVGTTRYYRNNHPGGVFAGFVDETARLNGTNGAACGGFSADFDQSGADDIYFGNYPGPSQDQLVNNDGTGNFPSPGTSGGGPNVPSDSDYTVDVAAGDINGDGKLDLLVSNEGDPCWIYYNDNQGNGSGVGDFAYTGSTTVFNVQNSLYPAMEPGDFNRDGRVDIYFANRGPGDRDAILINQGNDANNKATFTELELPGIVSDTPTAKVTVEDLNGDGRLDLVVMGGDTASQSEPARRPVIFRNTTVNGQTSFVEWSPNSAFPPGETHSGWHAAAFDVDGDKRKDIFVGGMNHDFLFKNEKVAPVKDTTIGGSLPAVHNLAPLAVLGSVSKASP